MADLTFENKNNQKKTLSIFASATIAAASGTTPSDELFTLPEASLVTNVSVIVIDAAAAGDTLDVKVGSTVVGNELDIASVGVDSAVTPAYFATGGAVTCVAGAGGALGADCEYKIVVEYIETELTNGQYTD